MTLNWSVASLVARGDIDASWADALAPVEPTLTSIARELSGTPFLPDATHVFRAFRMPLQAVRVLLLGQDPYPTPGHATGLAFSVDESVRPLPGSLRNILIERESDLGLPKPQSGDLSAWAEQGVLLLNRTLTVAPGEPLSHRHLGWSDITSAAVAGLIGRPQPLIVMAWGRDAQSAIHPFAAHDHVRVIESAHPSPLSASRGFLGSKPFSRANVALVELGLKPVDWSLPAGQSNAS